VSDAIQSPDTSAADAGGVRDVVVQTERMTLRRATTRDAEFIVRLLNEPSFIANIADRGVRTVEDAVGYLTNGPIRSYAEHGHGLYLVALRDEPGRAIGMCGLLRREQFADPDLGYAFLPEFWGRGLAAEAGAATLEHGRRDLGMTRFIAIVSPHNAGSIRVLEKLGFRFSHTIEMKPGEGETAVYVLPEA
jgi:ribosomal-protein-alanine N-acetyltransferase